MLYDSFLQERLKKLDEQTNNEFKLHTQTNRV